MIDVILLANDQLALLESLRERLPKDSGRKVCEGVEGAVWTAVSGQHQSALSKLFDGQEWAARRTSE